MNCLDSVWYISFEALPGLKLGVFGKNVVLFGNKRINVT
jgi:hypothetical protein